MRSNERHLHPLLGFAAAVLVTLAGTAARATPEGTIRGVVLDDTGRPLVGTKVTLGRAQIALTDQEGTFVLGLPPGRYLLSITPEGRTGVDTAPVEVLAEQETELLIIFPSSGAPTVEVEAPSAALAIATTETATQGTGRVQGRVTEGKDGPPIVGARLFVRGTPADARTNAEGRYELQLPEGARELTVLHPNFGTQVVKVQVRSDAPFTADVALEPKALELAEMVVTTPKLEGGAVFVLKERQDAATVTEVLGADQIAKSGDSDAAGALRRVTGVTVVDDRFVYVRGLGERYSSTLLNGSTLPSPDPERRVVPLDLFPAGVISNIVLHKTYSPELPAEFGGGTIDLKTREIPEEFTLGLGVSLGYLDGTTFRTGPTYGGGGLDFLTFGAGARAVPKVVADASASKTLDTGDRFNPGFTDEELERFGEAFDLNYGTTDVTTPPPVGLSAEAGGRFSIFGKDAGAYLALDWGHDFGRYDQSRTVFQVSEGGRLVPQNELALKVLSIQSTLSAIGAVSLDLSDDDHLRLTTTVNRIAEDEARKARGRIEETDTIADITRLWWIEQMLATAQLRGDHQLLPKLALEWRYMFSLATRDEPNRREIVYNASPESPDAFVFSTLAAGNQRFYSDLADLNHDLGAKVTLPLELFGQLESKLSGGLALELKGRDVSARRFRYDLAGTAEARDQVRLRPADQIFTDETIGPDLFRLEEVTLPDDNYRGDQRIFGAFLMGDLALLDSLKLLAGARLEHGAINLATRTPIAAPEDADVQSDYQKLDVLPAASTTWEFYTDMQLRAAFSRTVNRPNFRELSPARFFDVTDGTEYRGNPALTRALITHADLRWEWYPSPGESFSAAVFYKHFDDPIERSVNGGPNIVYKPINVDSAQLVGGEVEGRKSLDFLGESFEYFTVAANLTLVHSRVSIGEEGLSLTSKERALQGQSPYAVNVQLAYDNPDSETAIVAQLNVFGRRIESVGAVGQPDVYEEPVPLLDLVASQRIGAVKFGVKLKNLLNPLRRLTQTENSAEATVHDVFAYRRGVAGFLSLGVDLD